MGKEILGTEKSARWSARPSSLGTGRSAGNVVSGRRISTTYADVLGQS